MSKIEIVTEIEAPIERCFQLSLSVDLHVISAKDTNEKAVAGVTSGLMKLNDVVTWRAKHFGVYQNMTNKISDYVYPTYFVSEMVKGAFKKIYHQHLFQEKGNKTIMKDIFEFEAPLGLLGKVFSSLVLKNYMKRFLLKRNNAIKEAAENGAWIRILPPNPK